MDMTVAAWLSQKQGMTFRYKLEKMRAALALLGNPEQLHPVIHVAGTNGKGSTVAFLSQLCQHHGLKTGRFVSPHMVSVHDRICINDQPIAESDFHEIAREIQQLEKQVEIVYEPFSYFEVMTLLMFLYFSRQDLDVVLVEVGIGGLLDTTNVVNPTVSIITSIGLDHQEILGSSLEAIAAQKAGIIKPGIPVVVGQLPKEAEEVIVEKARRCQSPFWLAGRDFRIVEGQFSRDGVVFSNLVVSLSGTHQLGNAAVAVQAFCLFMEQRNQAISEQAVQAALAQTQWPGRMEAVTHQPTIYLDGAHNVAGLETLADFVETFRARSCTILFSALERKDIATMLAYLENRLPQVKLVLTRFSHKEAIGTEWLSDPRYVEDYQAFILDWRQTASSDAVLWITGSLYFISEVRPLLVSDNHM